MIVTCQKMQSVDQLALCMDLVRTAYLALQDQSMLNEREIESVTSVLNHALVNLSPVYDAVNKAYGEGKI